MISNFIGTMACLHYLNHLRARHAVLLSRFPDHPSRSKLRGIRLKINLTRNTLLDKSFLILGFAISQKNSILDRFAS